MTEHNFLGVIYVVIVLVYVSLLFKTQPNSVSFWIYSGFIAAYSVYAAYLITEPNQSAEVPIVYVKN